MEYFAYNAEHEFDLALYTGQIMMIIKIIANLSIKKSSSESYSRISLSRREYAQKES